MKKNPAIVETVRIAVGTTIATVIMLLCYLALGKFSVNVLCGAALGLILAVFNFFYMAVSLMNVADNAADPKGAVKMQGNFIFRMLIMVALIILGAKSGYCDPLASVLPIVFVRPVITIEQFFVKNSSKDKKEQPDEGENQTNNEEDQQ